MWDVVPIGLCSLIGVPPTGGGYLLPLKFQRLCNVYCVCLWRETSSLTNDDFGPHCLQLVHKNLNYIIQPCKLPSFTHTHIHTRTHTHTHTPSLSLSLSLPLRDQECQNDETDREVQVRVYLMCIYGNHSSVPAMHCV